MTLESFQTFDEALSYAAGQGITLTPRDYERITEAQIAEQKRLQKLTQQNSGRLARFVNVFNRYYPQFLQTLVGIGEVLMTTTQTLIVSLGVPVVLVLLLIVEQTRVYHGIHLFESTPALASFAAWALVILNLTLEFTIHFIEHRAGYTEPHHNIWSFRLWLENMRYTVGAGEHWQPRSASPAQPYRQLLRLVTFTILALALAGSMREVIAGTEGAWYQALGNILAGSTLTEMMTWCGGVLFATAAVLAAQRLSQYVALRCVEITGTMRQHTASELFSPEMETVAMNYVLAKVAAKQGKEGSQSSVPFGVTIPTAD